MQKLKGGLKGFSKFDRWPKAKTKAKPKRQKAKPRLPPNQKLTLTQTVDAKEVMQATC